MINNVGQYNMDSKQYFNGIADQWDQVRTEFFSDKVKIKAFTVAGVKAGKLAADIGAGTGFISEGLLEKGIKVIAVDQSPAMLEQMKNKFPSNVSIEYRIGVADRIPIENKSVDYVFANMYLHHVEIPLEAIKEMVRILKPGGRLVLTDLDEHDHTFLRTEQHDIWMGFKRESIRKWFKEAGLKKVDVNCLNENCCADSVARNDSAKVSIFIATGEK